MAEDSKLSELRNKIDAIDHELLSLLARRADLVVEVGKHKGDNNGNNFIRSGREARMIRNLTAHGAGHFPKSAIHSLWRNIISASLNLENGLKIVLPEKFDINAYKAIFKYFGTDVDYRQYEDPAKVLENVDNRTVVILTLQSNEWLKLGEPSHKHLKVFARLAEGIFAVGRLETEESGDDRTLAITHSDAHKGHQLATHGKVKLIELPGFLTDAGDAIIIGHYGL